jgi:hypothetical protein
MNKTERQEAYREVREHFRLLAAQRDKLDASSRLNVILRAAHQQRWSTVRLLLKTEGILSI